jgi:hypothetical protein
MDIIIMEMTHMRMVMDLDSRGDLLRITNLRSEKITLKKDLLMLEIVDMDMVMDMG